MALGGPPGSGPRLTETGTGGNPHRIVLPGIAQGDPHQGYPFPPQGGTTTTGFLTFNPSGVPLCNRRGVCIVPVGCRSYFKGWTLEQEGPPG